MAVDPRDEYLTLRTEMLERFHRIFEIEKFGAGGLLALIAYIQVAPTDLTGSLALGILEVLILLMGLVALNEFQAIYRLGTYLAVVSERDSSAIWHRMSRKLPRFLDTTAGRELPRKARRPFPLVSGGVPTARSSRLSSWY